MILIVCYSWKIRPGKFLFVFCLSSTKTKKNKNKVHKFKGRKMPKHADRPFLFVTYLVSLRLWYLLWDHGSQWTFWGSECSQMLKTDVNWKVITKTYLYNFDPLKPHFYIVKLGFTGVYVIFLFSAQNIDCEYSLEPPRRGGSNEYTQSMFWAEIWKISEFFIWKFSIFGDEIFNIFE